MFMFSVILAGEPVVGVPTFPYGPTSFDGGGMAAAGLSAAYRVDLSKKIPQLSEDNYLDWLFSISTCFAAMGLSKLLAAGYRGATSGVSESSGFHMGGSREGPLGRLMPPGVVRLAPLTQK